MRPIEESIPAALAGERVDRVAALVSGLSRSAVGRLIDDGAVQVDGVRIDTPALRVVEGQQLRIELSESAPALTVADPGVPVPVVYADAFVVVVDKPAGMVVHAGAGRAEGTMVNGLLALFPDLADVGDPARPGIVHRLDRGTSGLLVVARTPDAHRALVDQMKQRLPRRSYTALVWGHPEADSGTIDAPVGRSRRHPTRMTVTPRGRPAITHYEVERRFHQPTATARLRCRLETGRTHQIRVHLQAIGHPVVGDAQYGGARPGIDLDRPFLHAGELSFVHPARHELVRFESPLPPELTAVLDSLA